MWYTGRRRICRHKRVVGTTRYPPIPSLLGDKWMKREGDTNECVCNKCSSSSLRWFLRCRKWREFITSSRELHHRPADRRRTFFLLLLYYAWGELPASKPSSAAYLREERGSFRPALVEIVSSACALSTIIQIETERIMQHFFYFSSSFPNKENLQKLFKINFAPLLKKNGRLFFKLPATTFPVVADGSIHLPFPAGFSMLSRHS